MEDSTTVRTIGTFGNYHVAEMIEDKTLFPEQKIRNRETGEIETKRVRIHKNKRTIILTHSRSGEKILFSSYRHGGKLRFRDSREKTSRTDASPIHAELRRLLGVDNDMTHRLIPVPLQEAEAERPALVA